MVVVVVVVVVDIDGTSCIGVREEQRALSRPPEAVLFRLGYASV